MLPNEIYILPYLFSCVIYYLGLYVNSLIRVYIYMYLKFRSNYEVAELTWENGQLAMHGLGGLLPTAPTKPTWGRAGDTLESIVHQATCHNQNSNFIHHAQNLANMKSTVGSSAHVQTGNQGLMKKRTRSDSAHCGRNFSTNVHEAERADRSACASASATFCRDNETTMMTWPSSESPRSLKAKTTDEDSACHGGSVNNTNFSLFSVIGLGTITIIFMINHLQEVLQQ